MATVGKATSPLESPNSFNGLITISVRAFLDGSLEVVDIADTLKRREKSENRNEQQR